MGLADLLPDHPYNPWTLQRYHETREEGVAVAENGLDFGVVHNKINEHIRGSQFTTYHAALEDAEAAAVANEPLPSGTAQRLLELQHEIYLRMTQKEIQAYYRPFELTGPQFDWSYLHDLDMFVQDAVTDEQYDTLSQEAVQTTSHRLPGALY